MNTWLGGLLTILIHLAALAYAMVKANELITQSNPDISETVIPGQLTEEDSISLKDIDFRAAFTLVSKGLTDHPHKEHSRDDPRYVKQYLFMHERVEGEGIYTPLKFHDCTPEDLKEIYVVSHESQHEWEQMVEDEDVRF